MSTPRPQATIPDTELRMLASSNVSQEFSIFVALPHTYAQDDRAYPVVYMLDANMAFGIATETVRMLSFRNDIPEVIIVGIGYPVRTFKDTVGFRTRDLTPTETDWYENSLKPVRPDAPEYAGSGRAADFLQFMREELMPLINADYRTVPQDNALVGFSLGGLFGLYVLFSQPDTFRHYVVGSPSVWWDNGMILSLEKEFAAKNNDLVAKVFMSIGGSEAPNMISDMYKMVDVLRNRKYRNLELTTHFFEGETHMSNPPAFISRGLRAAFG